MAELRRLCPTKALEAMVQGRSPFSICIHVNGTTTDSEASHFCRSLLGDGNTRPELPVSVQFQQKFFNIDMMNFQELLVAQLRNPVYSTLSPSIWTFTHFYTFYPGSLGRHTDMFRVLFLCNNMLVRGHGKGMPRAIFLKDLPWPQSGLNYDTLDSASQKLIQKNIEAMEAASIDTVAPMSYKECLSFIRDERVLAHFRDVCVRNGHISKSDYNFPLYFISAMVLYVNGARPEVIYKSKLKYVRKFTDEGGIKYELIKLLDAKCGLSMTVMSPDIRTYFDLYQSL
uniref:Uncharacterized protein n=1 Tax=Romanomermis culicivorax TaxID=13658 RepID=A0A915KZ56_ROMCU